MRVVHSKLPLPRSFSARFRSDGVEYEADIGLSRNPRLFAKLLVFRHPTAMLRFWKHHLGKPQRRGTIGLVQQLATQHESFKNGDGGRKVLECDPRYFCIIGLCKNHLTAEVIVHEAMHVGFAYAKRIKGNPWTPFDDVDEERVCYPAGIAADAMIEQLRRWELIE